MSFSDTSSVAVGVPLMLRRQGIDVLAALAVSLLATMLLLYVGYAEALRGLPALRDDRAAAMVKLLDAAARSPDSFARDAAAVLSVDPAMGNAALTAADGRTIASAWRAEFPLTGPRPDGMALESAVKNATDDSGRLTVTARRDLSDVLQHPFQRLLAAMIVLSLLAAVLAAAARERLGEKGAVAAGAALFAAMALCIAWALAGLQIDSLEIKGRAQAALLGQRVAAAPDLTARRIEPLSALLAAAQTPGVETALLRDGRIVAHADPARLEQDWDGESWLRAPWVINHAAPATAADGERLTVATRLNPAALLDRPDIQRMGKNFLALLAASGFVAQLIRQMVMALRTDGARLLGVRTRAVEIGDATLERIKPIFFLAVLVENMGYAFLPALLKDVAAHSGLPAGVASALFMTYFFGFALILMPAGQIAGRYGPKPLINFGAALVTAGLFLMALTLDALAMGLARFMTGIGQGMILIGVQSYILEVAAVGHRTRGTAIIVFGFNTGMIAGIALGSLLVEHLGPQGVFLLSGAITVVALLFTMGLLPALARPTGNSPGLSYAVRELGRNTTRAMTSMAFIRATFLVGIPNKAVMTGVILFALPLLLSQQGMNAEEIGQIIMFYAAGMLITSPVVSRLVDMVGETRRVLFIGSLVSGLGLLLIGATATPWFVALPHHGMLVTLTLTAAVTLIGAAHGFVNAPVVTHVAELAISREVGSARVAATYRFLERLGHVAGPIVVGQVLQLAGADAGAVAWVGGAVILCALAFSVRLSDRRRVKVKKLEIRQTKRRIDTHR